MYVNVYRPYMHAIHSLYWCCPLSKIKRSNNAELASNEILVVIQYVTTTCLPWHLLQYSSVKIPLFFTVFQEDCWNCRPQLEIPKCLERHDLGDLSASSHPAGIGRFRPSQQLQCHRTLGETLAERAIWADSFDLSMESFALYIF